MKSQPSVHAHFIPPFRNLIPQEPHGKVLYRDKVVVRQIYDTVAAIAANESKKHDPHRQLDSFEWKPRNDANFESLALLLSATVYDAGSVSELTHKIEREGHNKSYSPVVHPAMPIMLRGIIRYRRDVFRNVIRLHDDESSIRIILDNEHTLFQDLDFLKERFLFVLGLIESIEKLTVKAGAILL